MTNKALSEYLATIGARGGKAGTGDAKRRTRDHYRLMALRAAAAKREKKRLKEQSDETTTTDTDKPR